MGIHHSIIWPPDNLYLTLGFNEINDRHPEFCNNVIFIDFSLYNLKLFTNDEWLQYGLPHTKPLILIYDNYMEPLAEYWLQSTRRVVTRVSRKACYEIFTLSPEPERRMFYRAKISDSELAVMQQLLTGKSIQEAADALDCDERRIYRLKHAFENKMHIKIKLTENQATVLIRP